jgi:hypothetical protein
MNLRKTISKSSKIKTQWGSISDNYKNKYNLSNVKLKLLNIWAPIRNHLLFNIVKDKVINLIFTGFIISIILFSFRVPQSLFKGVGIAITLNLWQFYTKWYFKTKEKPWR